MPPTLASIASKQRERAFILATDNDWGTTHILSKPGSRTLALCGRRPLIVWTRVWTVFYSSTDDVPACAQCRGTLHASSPKPPSLLRALIVDDNATDRTYVHAILKGLGKEIRVEETDSARAALALLSTIPFDLVVSDYHLMGSETGVDVLAEARRLRPDSRRILVTGDSRQQVRQQAIRNDVAHAVAIKTDGPTLLRSALMALLGSSDLGRNTAGVPYPN